MQQEESQGVSLESRTQAACKETGISVLQVQGTQFGQKLEWT
jgi:hypothetical protein